MVQWLGLDAFTAVGLGSIPGWGTKILQAKWRGQNNKNNKKENHGASLVAQMVKKENHAKEFGP